MGRTIAAMACIGAFGLAACDRAPPQKAEEPPVVRVMRIGTAQDAQGIEFAGEVRARH